MGQAKGNSFYSDANLPPASAPPAPPTAGESSRTLTSNPFYDDVLVVTTDMDASSNLDERERPCQKSTTAVIGPSVRIHRYDLGIRALQILAIVWLLSGISFLTVVALCVAVNSGYVTFQANGIIHVDAIAPGNGDMLVVGAQATLPIVVAFTFYTYFLVKFYYSLLRTFLRMCMGVWREQFGAGEHDFILVRWVDPLAHRLESCFFPARISEFDNVQARERHVLWVEVIKTLILFVLVTGLVGVPLFYAAIVYGYWGIINTICMFIVLGSSCLILVVNIFTRIYRFGFFVYKLCTELAVGSNIPARLRAAFLASTHQDTRRNLINVYCERGIFVLLMVLLASLVFGMQIHLGVLIPCALVAFVLLLIRMRRFASCYIRKVTGGTDDLRTLDPSQESTIPQHRRHVLSRMMGELEWDGYTRGQSWHPVVVTLAIRSICLALGVASLVYMDLHGLQETDEVKIPEAFSPIDSSAQGLFIGWAALFVVVTILKELSMVVPLCHALVRPVLLTLLQLFLVAIAIYGRVVFVGFTATAFLIILLYGMDYRDARWFWTNHHASHTPCRNRRRVMRNTYLTLILLLFFAVGSIFTGLLVGYSRDSHGKISLDEFRREYQKYVETFRENHPELLFTPPICAMAFSEDRISVIDLGIMSRAAYQPNATAALSVVNISPKLRSQKWRVGKFHLGAEGADQVSANDTFPAPVFTPVVSGVHFVEFVNQRNLSVVAIRGTKGMEDIYQDLYLWSTVSFLQWSSYFGTYVNIWPTETVAQVVYFITRYASYPSLLYWEELQSIVVQIMDGKPEQRQRPSILERVSATLSGRSTREPSVDSQVLLTGHSLGGGLSNILAGHLRIPSVSFSAPGLGYSALNYNLTEESLMTNTINVIPANDPVPKLDKQVGMVQNIPCDAAQPFLCHDLNRAILTLKAICGNGEKSNSGDA